MENLSKEVFVSVNIITYNHEKYIASAIDSVLSQKINCPIEIVICDDYSTDNTREILQSYKLQYPDLIHLRLRDKNLGLKYNYFDNIQYCNGKYIAICEGDDYWTDCNKLQLQVDFLEDNDSYSMCFHNAVELHEFDSTPRVTNIFRNLENRDYTPEEILLNWLIPTASVVFRKPISLKFKYLDEFLFYDIILFLRLSEYGKIKCFPNVMCIYRRHSNSITNSNLSYLDFIHHIIYLNKEFNNKFYAISKQIIATEYFKRYKVLRNKNKFLSLIYLLKAIVVDYTVIADKILYKIKN